MRKDRILNLHWQLRSPVPFGPLGEFWDWLAPQIKRRVQNSRYPWPQSSPTVLTLSFVGVRAMSHLNFKYRHKRGVTDILSFPSPVPLGELIFCWPVLTKQAAVWDMPLQDEFVFLWIHGVLHLLGFDHEGSQKSARKMFRIQEEIFEQFKKSDFYHCPLLTTPKVRLR